MIRIKKIEIKKEILKYVSDNRCSSQFQIINHFEFKDSRYITIPLKELLDEGKIEKVPYKGLKFYTLANNEMEIKRKIKIIKQNILEIVKVFGPIKARPLVNQIKDNFDVDVNYRLIFKLAKELIQENKLSAKKLALSNVYYETSNQSQEFMADKLIQDRENKRRESKLTSICENFVKMMCNIYQLNDEEILKLNTIYPKIKNILFNYDFKGRNYKEVIGVLYLLSVKKEIFFKSKKGVVSYSEIKPWLNLHEILYKYNLDAIKQGRYKTKTFLTIVKSFLDCKEFCYQKNKAKILNTPNEIFRIKYLLNGFALSEDLRKEVLNFIKFTVSKGYIINGKSCKGILAGALYLFSENKELKITQKIISDQLGITEATLRSRRNDLLNYLIEYEESIGKKKKLEEKKHIKLKTLKTMTILDFIQNNFED